MVGVHALVRVLDGPREEDEATRRDRYRGGMVGLAVGNALGGPVEGWPAQAIRERFPGGLREISPQERNLPWDDDLAQAVLLAEVLVEGELRADDLAKRLLRWRRESGRGIGLLTSRVLNELAAGTPADQAAREVWERSGRRLAGNGAVMRCAPVALRWRGSPERLVGEARTSALVTHHDPRCEWSTVATVGLVALALDGRGVPVRELAEGLVEAGAPQEVADAAVAAEEAELGAFVLDDDAMGYTLKAMQVSVWAGRRAEGFEDVLVEVVAAGGDTDTNGAVAGAVMGARVGLRGIPPRWVEGVSRTDRLIELADRLLEASRD